MKSLFKITVAATLCASILVSSPVLAADYVLSTASTGGTYHPVGTAIATLSKVKLLPTKKFSLTAVNSAGSSANVQALGANTAQFAILQGLFGSYAATGTGPVSEPQKNLRAVSMLWQNVEQFVVPTPLAKTGTVSDLVALKGKTLVMGKQNSGSLGSNKVVMSGLGLDITKDYTLLFAGFGPSADMLANGQAIGGSFPAGAPTGALTKLFAANKGKFKLLSVTPEQAAKMDGGRKLWTPYTVTADTYPGLTEDVQTIAQPNFLAVNADVNEEHVYLLTKSIYENLPFLQAIHNATKAMDVKRAVAGLPVPLHPGAYRYYKEVGVEVPDRLIAK